MPSTEGGGEQYIPPQSYPTPGKGGWPTQAISDQRALVCEMGCPTRARTCGIFPMVNLIRLWLRDWVNWKVSQPSK